MSAYQRSRSPSRSTTRPGASQVRTARHGDIALAEPGEPSPAGLPCYSMAELLHLRDNLGDVDMAAAVKRAFGGTVGPAPDEAEITAAADRRPLCGPRGILIERFLAVKSSA